MVMKIATTFGTDDGRLVRVAVAQSSFPLLFPSTPLVPSYAERKNVL